MSTIRQRALAAVVMIVAAACGGPRTSRDPDPPSTAGKPTGDPESRFGPLEVGNDYLGYRKLTEAPFLSLAHGNRWVEVYVNEIGADAYLGTGEIPVGTIVVKTSWIDADHAPSSTPGPIYVMEKRAPGYAPDHDDWYYAIHWADPPPDDARKFGGPIYWRGASPRAAFCWECHDNYDRSLGGLVPSSQLPR